MVDTELHEARKRGEDLVASILARPDMLTADQLAGRIGTVKRTIYAWRTQLRILGLNSAGKHYRYPEWQIAPNGMPFPELPVLHVWLCSPWAVYRFLLQHHPELDGTTGLEALQTGRGSKAVEAAEGIARGAFS